MKNQKGITLIALIITIIVMLILVGVSVTVALNGGLFTTAKDAADRYEAEKVNEEKMATEEYIQGIIDNIGGTDESEYTLSGVWQFISTIQPETAETNEFNVSQDITFTVTNSDEESSWGEIGTYTYSSISAYMVTCNWDTDIFMLEMSFDSEYMYNASENWDGSSYDFDTLDFGTEPQEVSQEFYEWFTANANPVE